MTIVFHTPLNVSHFSERRNRDAIAVNCSEIRAQPIGNSAGDVGRGFIGNRED
jgi:hypothetical protein